MTMGRAKIEQVLDSKGMMRQSRIPQKPLNLYIKGALLAILERNDIKIKSTNHAGSSVFTVTDSKGKYLFSYDNAWDYGYYRIFMANSKAEGEPILVAEMDWYENDGYTNKQQQDIFDVFEAIKVKAAKLDEIEAARQSLTAEEVLALQAMGIKTQIQI